jgi:hypothetical protein
MGTVHAAGHRIAYDLKGEGAPLVLLHRYVGDGRMCRALPFAVATRRDTHGVRRA